MYSDKGLNGTAMRAILKSKFGISSHSDLTITQASEWIRHLQTIEKKVEEVDKEPIDLDSIIDEIDGEVE
jgi:hypothetical protein